MAIISFIVMGFLVMALSMAFVCCTAIRRRQFRRREIARIHRMIALRQALDEKFSGLKQTVIDALPIVPFSQLTLSNEDDLQCSVCLVDYNTHDDIKLLVCKHYFHSACLDEWLVSHTTCPICRISLEEEEVVPTVASVTEEEDFRGTNTRQPFPSANEDVENVIGLNVFSSSAFEGHLNEDKGGERCRPWSEESLGNENTVRLSSPDGTPAMAHHSSHLFDPPSSSASGY